MIEHWSWAMYKYIFRSFKWTFIIIWITINSCKMHACMWMWWWCVCRLIFALVAHSFVVVSNASFNQNQWILFSIVQPTMAIRLFSFQFFFVLNKNQFERQTEQSIGFILSYTSSIFAWKKALMFFVLIFTVSNPFHWQFIIFFLRYSCRCKKNKFVGFILLSYTQRERDTVVIKSRFSTGGGVECENNIKITAIFRKENTPQQQKKNSRLIVCKQKKNVNRQFNESFFKP